uniref:ATPase subunit 8 n=1 Tax=Pleurocladia lacustris TaxID=246121 RepID=A0A1I9LW72_9PHAE|nr:ATPase subunit 8 [Pleurocladia lacustris]ANS57842.1 ATPase subunit 8 [Pleurocladia lacustris]ANS57884.1 ATPase subunit 8 [Pleurocladia lacustris]
MPQFDTMTFFNQVFWLISIIFTFYVIIVRYMLPSLAFSLKSRSKNQRLTISANSK